MSINQLRPFFIIGHATLFSSLPEEELLQVVEKVLNIPKFTLDTSGDYEGEGVYLSYCFCLEVFFARDESTSDRYHIAVHNARGSFSDIDVDEVNLDWHDTLIALLQKSNLIVRERRDEDEDDYD